MQTNVSKFQICTKSTLMYNVNMQTVITVLFCTAVCSVHTEFLQVRYNNLCLMIALAFDIQYNLHHAGHTGRAVRPVTTEVFVKCVIVYS